MSPISGGKGCPRAYAAAEAEIREYLKCIVDAYGYADAFLVSPAGDEVFELKRSGQCGTNYLTGPYRDTELARSFEKARDTGKLAFSRFAPCALRRRRNVHRRAGARGKVAAGSCHPGSRRREIHRMVNNYSGLGETGEIVVASLLDGAITFVAPTRHDPGAAFKRTVSSDDGASHELECAVRKLEEQGIGADYRGVQSVAAGRYLPSWNWGMVVKMNADEVFALVTRERRWGVLLGVPVLLLVAGLAYWAAASFSQPIVRLTTAAQRMAAGELSERVAISRGDEIGELAHDFNNMAAALKTMYSTIEQRVEERTRELREQEERFRQLAENIHQVFWLMSSDLNKIIYVSPAYERLWGRSIDSLYASPHSWLDAVHPDDRDRVREEWRQAIAAEQEFECEYRLLRSDGAIRWIFDRGFPVRDSSGKMYRMAGLAEDVTERRLAEEAMRRAKEAAEDADRVKGDFLRNISHEIRTPMNGIIGLTELTLDTPLSSEQHGNLEGVMTSAESLLEMIDSILDFSRLEERGLTLEQAPFALRKWLKDAIGTLEPRAREKGLVLCYEVRPDVPDDLIGDPARLWQILVNLVGNAIKFTRQGEVCLRVELEELLSENACLRFTVSDTGIGIPADKRESLFLPFMQVDSSKTRKFGGAGMGLAVSARLVEMMGGRIWFESELGQGSSFHFTASFGRPPARLPLDAPRATAAVTAGEGQAEGAAAASSAAAPMRILVAEDNPINQQLIARLLQKAGHAVTVTNDGEEALAAVAKENFDLVLMDVQMPVLDGFEATAEIRRREIGTGRRLPIVALTAHAMQGDREQCLDAGMDGYVAKPIRTGELFAAIVEATATHADAPSPAQPID